MCYSSVPLGVLCCIILSFLWLSPAVMSQPSDNNGYAVSVLLFCIGTLVELSTEPLVILGQAHQYVTTKVGGWGIMFMLKPRDVLLAKVLVEGASQLCKCVFTVAMVMWFPQWGVTAPSVANVCANIQLP